MPVAPRAAASFTGRVGHLRRSFVRPRVRRSGIVLRLPRGPAATAREAAARTDRQQDLKRGSLHHRERSRARPPERLTSAGSAESVAYARAPFLRVRMTRWPPRLGISISLKRNLATWMARAPGVAGVERLRWAHETSQCQANHEVQAGRPGHARHAHAIYVDVLPRAVHLTGTSPCARD
jgi:hypothetical protein